MPYSIQIRTGSQEGELYPLSQGREAIIGRDPTCNISVSDRYLSRFHCQVALKEDRCTLTDLQSTNGTFVNQESVTECELKPGCEIKVGGTTLGLVEVDDEGRPVTTSVME